MIGETRTDQKRNREDIINSQLLDQTAGTDTLIKTMCTLIVHKQMGCPFSAMDRKWKANDKHREQITGEFPVKD